MARQLNIACLQTRPMPDFQSAQDEAMPLAQAAIDAGAEMIFLPEYCGGLVTNGPALQPPSAPEAVHPVLQAFQHLARTRHVWIQVGSIAIKQANCKIKNRGFMIDDTGKIVGRYDKIHLFDISLSEAETYRESDTVLAGSEAVIHNTPFGQLGHTICYDLRFAELYRDLAKAGAEMISVPAAFTQKTGEAHWHVLNRARAIETGSFIIAPCAVGDIPGGGASYGHSLVINPWGEVLADGGDLPGVVQTTIDLDAVQSARRRIPSLEHDQIYIISTESERNVA